MVHRYGGEKYIVDYPKGVVVLVVNVTALLIFIVEKKVKMLISLVFILLIKFQK